MRHRYVSHIPFIDFLLSFSVITLFLLGMLMLLMTSNIKKADIESKGEVMITVEWTTNDDVDTWVRTPTGNIVSYHDKEKDLVFLDRDDMGNTTDTIVLADGTIKEENIHREVVTVRRLLTGRYDVNIFMFNKKVPDLSTVRITVLLLNPYFELLRKEVILRSSSDEAPIVSLTFDENGKLINYDDGIMWVRKNAVGQK